MSTLHQTLAASAAAGDDAALERLVRAYHDRVYRFGVRVCRDPFDADDAVQQAFSKLARRPDVQRDPSALSWLMTVVRNACRRLAQNFVRLAPNRAPLSTELAELEGLETPELDPEAALERWQLVHNVHRAIARLERPYREVLILRDVEGLSGAEVASSLGLSEAAMKSRLHRARSLVREQLESVRH